MGLLGGLFGGIFGGGGQTGMPQMGGPTQFNQFGLPSNKGILGGSLGSVRPGTYGGSNIPLAPQLLGTGGGQAVQGPMSQMRPTGQGMGEGFKPAPNAMPDYQIAGDLNNYLMRTAQIESNGNPKAVSSTGAKGLFQFTKGTWNSMVKKYGATLGVQGDMRTDPNASLKVMKKFTEENAGALQKSLGRPARPYELYMAHNLGVGGAEKLLNASNDTPVTKALIGSNPKFNPKFLTNGGRTITAAEAIQRYQEAFAGL